MGSCLAVVCEALISAVPKLAPLIPATESTYPFSLAVRRDRKSTRLNSSHTVISYAVFCLKKKQDARLLAPLHARILPPGRAVHRRPPRRGHRLHGPSLRARRRTAPCGDVQRGA